MKKPGTYVGLDQDVLGGMTTIGKTIRDGWIFGIIPETEMCTDWNLARLDALLQNVNTEWDKYGCMVSQLPEELRERHARIHEKAIEKAKAAGWSGEFETDDNQYTDIPKQPIR